MVPVVTPKHRTVVITGGGRGIGAATARAFAAEGASIVVSARSVNEIEAVSASLRADGAQAWAIPCDVTDPTQIGELQRQSSERFGRPADILINNAGIADSRPVRDITVENWDRLFSVNVRGVMLCIQAFLPAMLESGWGRIVTIASIAGKVGAPYIATYASSKHAVIGLTRSIASEVAAKGITVNAVCPGYVDTDMTQQSIDRIMRKTGISREEAMKHLEAANPQRRLIAPEEVAFTTVSLCQDLARGINGQSIVIDGGWIQS